LIDSWKSVWIINGALAFAAALFYGLFASSEQQSWDFDKQNKEGLENPAFEDEKEKIDRINEDWSTK